MSKTKRVFIVLGILVAIIPCGYLAYGLGMTVLTIAVMGYDSIRRTANWRDYTIPLEHDVVLDICKQISLPENDPRCQPDTVVYAPDFFRTIGQFFQPTNHAWATYEEVEAKLGAYKYKQEPVVTESDGKQYFRCWYDLQGDRVHPIVISFYADGRLWRIIADVGT